MPAHLLEDVSPRCDRLRHVLRLRQVMANEVGDIVIVFGYQDRGGMEADISSRFGLAGAQAPIRTSEAVVPMALLQILASVHIARRTGQVGQQDRGSNAEGWRSARRKRLEHGGILKCQPASRRLCDGFGSECSDSEVNEEGATSPRRRERPDSSVVYQATANGGTSGRHSAPPLRSILTERCVGDVTARSRGRKISATATPRPRVADDETERQRHLFRSDTRIVGTGTERYKQTGVSTR